MTKLITNSAYVNYSYPSSPHAVQFGFAKNGCFTVVRDTLKKNGATVGLAAFPSKMEALLFANEFNNRLAEVV